MGDWLSAESLYVPSWVIIGTAAGLWGPTSMMGKFAWAAIGLVIASFAWRASAKQTRQSREITKNLGKLVSVTEPSPANILAAAAAKILELEGGINDLKDRRPRTISAEQWDQMSDVFRALGSRTVRIVVVFQEKYYEAARYGREFAGFFQHHGIGGAALTNAVPPVPDDMRGVVIRYDNGSQKPEVVDRLARALAVTHVEYRIEASPFPPELRNCCELIIGRND